MQAVILAAGRGKRMKELTENLPKPMLTVLGNNLIEHKLAVLPEEIDEVIIIIGYLGEKIRQHFGENFHGRKIRYVEQKELMGTMSALKEAAPMLTGRFLVMMGDDLYSKEDIESCLKHRWALLVKKIDEKGQGGRVVIDDKKRIVDITEGDLEKGMLINAALYVLGIEIFKYPLVKIPSGEFGLPQTLARVAKDFDVTVVESKSWHQITSPEDIVKVEEALKI